MCKTLGHYVVILSAKFKLLYTIVKPEHVGNHVSKQLPI